ncbi:MAG: hypothetical protein HYR94_05500 [Chloroflexi bacterium]|nr:hypothetical protein [Chloroflexota bacterium]
MQEQLLETWRIHYRINLYLLDAITPEALAGVSASKGRNVGEQFAHIHNVRLMWLQSAVPQLMAELAKIEKQDANDKELLRRSLEGSGRAIEQMLMKGLESGASGKIKGFKPHVVAFVGYLISHEAYHHGEMGIILTQSGHPLDKKTAFGMWEWGVR